MNIRTATVEDVPAIRQIALVTWPAAYHPHILGKEQLAYMLELFYAEKVLHDTIASGKELFLLAWNDGAYSGFAAYTLHHRPGTTRLHKLYTLPARQGTGTGSELLDHVTNEAARSGDSVVELNVNKHNPAIGFYQRHGFRVVRDEVIDIGQGFVMDDHVMQRPVDPGRKRWPPHLGTGQR